MVDENHKSRVYVNFHIEKLLLEGKNFEKKLLLFNLLIRGE